MNPNKRSYFYSDWNEVPVGNCIQPSTVRHTITIQVDAMAELSEDSIKRLINTKYKCISVKVDRVDVLCR